MYKQSVIEFGGGGRYYLNYNSYSSKPSTSIGGY